MSRNLIVMLHGLGSNGSDLESLIPYIKKRLPESEFFSPNGIEPCDLFPFGYQWFSLSNREDKAILGELERVEPYIREMILTKANSLGFKEKDVILLGFSQGTMTSLYLALSNDNPYKAVIGFSGALILPNNIKQRDVPICLIHGLDDEVVEASNLALAKDKLSKENISIKTFLYENLAHSIDIRGLESAINFIKEIEK